MSSDSEPENVSSDRSEPDSFEEVPENKCYKFKVGTKGLAYTLKKGKKLPYITKIKGLDTYFTLRLLILFILSV